MEHGQPHTVVGALAHARGVACVSVCCSAGLSSTVEHRGSGEDIWDEQAESVWEGSGSDDRDDELDQPVCLPLPPSVPCRRGHEPLMELAMHRQRDDGYTDSSSGSPLDSDADDLPDEDFATRWVTLYPSQPSDRDHRPSKFKCSSNNTPRSPLPDAADGNVQATIVVDFRRSQKRQRD